jgi:diketogulonate reductase-like aldo/keto reductase
MFVDFVVTRDHLPGIFIVDSKSGDFQHPDFMAIVKRTGASPAQVVFRFAIGIGILPLTGTTDPMHMAEDLGLFRPGTERRGSGPY